MGAKNSKRPKYDEEIDRIISIEERLDRGYHEFLNNHTRDRVGFITDYTIAEPTPVIDSEYLKSVSREPYQENKMNDIIKQLDKKVRSSMTVITQSDFLMTDHGSRCGYFQKKWFQSEKMYLHPTMYISFYKIFFSLSF